MYRSALRLLNRAGRRLVLAGPAIGLLLALGSGGLALADVCPEPNNDAAAACFLPDAASIAGTIDGPADRDVYRIEVPAPGTKIQLELGNMPAGSDYDLALVNESLEVVGQSIQEGSAPERIEITLQAAGNYYAYVWVDQGRGFDPGTPYSLGLALTGRAAAGPPTGEPSGPPAGEPSGPPAGEPSGPPADSPPGGPVGQPPAAPSGPPAFSGLRCGWDAGGGGAVTSGGQLSPIGEATIHCRFDWQNVQPGSSIVFEFSQEKETRSRETIQLAEPAGSKSVAVNRIGGSGKRFVKVNEGTPFEREVEEQETYTCEVKIHLDGKQVAAVWFTIG